MKMALVRSELGLLVMEERVKNKGETVLNGWNHGLLKELCVFITSLSLTAWSRFKIQHVESWGMRKRQGWQCGATDTQRCSWQLIDIFFSLAITPYYTICLLHNDTIRENIINFIWNDVKQRGATQAAPLLSSLRFWWPLNFVLFGIGHLSESPLSQAYPFTCTPIRLRLSLEHFTHYRGHKECLW